MTLTDLIKSRYFDSKYTSYRSLAEDTNNTQPFVQTFIVGDKESRAKEDRIFEELFKGVSIETFMAALDLIEQIEREKIAKEQFL